MAKKQLLFLGDSHIQVFQYIRDRNLLPDYELNTMMIVGASAQGMVNWDSKTNALAEFTKALQVPTKDYSMIFTQLGEVDCGYSIWYRMQKHGTSREEELQRSVEHYLQFLLQLRSFGYRHICITGAVLPTIPDDVEWEGEVAKIRSEVTVSYRERTDITLQYNTLLQEKAKEHGFYYCDITADILDPESQLLDRHFANEDPKDHHLSNNATIDLWVSQIQAVMDEAKKRASQTNVVLLNDTSEWYHWGCTGTSQALHAHIKRKGYPLTSISVKAIYECEHVPTTISSFDDAGYFEQFCRVNMALMQPIKNADMVLINGEGTLHGISPVTRALLYIAYAAKKFLKKNVQIINHSAYPEDSLSITNEMANRIYQGVYARMDYIAVREHLCHRLLMQLGLQTVLSFDCLPLYITEHYRFKGTKDPKILVLAGSVAWNETRLPKLVSYLERMQQKGFQIRVLIGAKANIAEDDIAFVEHLKQSFSGEWESINAKTMEEWLDVIAGAGLLVSGRFHHTIAATILETACVVLNSNTPKMDALMEIVKMPLPLSYDDPELVEKLWERSMHALEVGHGSKELTDVLCTRALLNFGGI